MTETVSILARATRRALEDLESEARPSAEVYAGLTTLFAEHGLDENTAESAVDWLEGGPDLLVESITSALSALPAAPTGRPPRVVRSAAATRCLDCNLHLILFDDDEHFCEVTQTSTNFHGTETP